MVGFCIRQLMNDRILLDKFRSGEVVTPKDILRRLVLCERSYHPEINDNLLQKAAAHYVIKEDSHSAFFTEGLQTLAWELLVQEDDHLRVKKEMMGIWQETLTYCSPLLLLAAWSTNPDKGSFVDKGIINTALVPPSDLISLLGDVKLYDQHFHLNGSTELDVLWQDALLFPEKYRVDFDQALKNNLVVEHVEQIYPKLSDSTELFLLLREARSIRWYIVHYLLKTPSSSSNAYLKVTPAIDFTNYQDKEKHPLARNPDLYSTISLTEAKSFLQNEYWMYVLIFRQLYKRGGYSEGAELAKWFHYYLLILGLMNKMVVQQSDQYGFRQFQKITVNELRNNSEKDYRDRFQQMLTIDGDIAKSHVRRLEGRFAPKEDSCKLFRLLQNIHKGIEGIKSNAITCALTAHFIKRPLDEFDQMRYDKVRHSLWNSCIALDSLLSDPNACKSLHLEEHPVVAIDAAASEFDTPPEVFAPIFRFLRSRHNRLQFTYHAGEDYYHPLSGLRAIYEAITFFDYREYDRIGHATALGITPSLWFHRMPHSLYLAKEEWIDDLLFCLHILELQPSALYDEIVQLIERLSGGKDVGLLTQAWLARCWDPDCLDFTNSLDIDPYRREEFSNFNDQALSEDIKAVLKEHWQMKHFAGLNEPVLVDASVISADVIEKVQQKLMDLICSKGIFLETLPTSNLRISIYKSFAEHHIKNWIDGNAIQDKPHVVIGTDDPGIFATNIVYEYSHVAQLYGEKNGKNVINKIVKDSQDLVDHQIKSNP